MAGTLAERSYANADAARHLETAIDVSRRVPGVSDDDRAELWTRIGGLRELAGTFAGLGGRLPRRRPTPPRGPRWATPKVLTRQAAAHLRTGTSLTAATRAVTRARRLLDEATTTAASPADTGSASTASPRFVRLEQERLGDARAGPSGRWRPPAARVTTRRLVRALVFLDTWPTSSWACRASGRDTARRSRSA